MFEVEKDSFVVNVVEIGEEVRQQVAEQVVSPAFDDELLRESEERVLVADMVVKKVMSQKRDWLLIKRTEQRGIFGKKFRL